MYNIIIRMLLHRAKRAKYAEHYRRKNRYEQGMWNVNTVMMGGLGGDPRSSGSSSEEGTCRSYYMYVHVCMQQCVCLIHVLYIHVHIHVCVHWTYMRSVVEIGWGPVITRAI